MPPITLRRLTLKKRKTVEKHKYKVIGPIEEIYPETGQKLIRPQVKIKRAIFLVILTLAAITLFCWGVLKIASLFDWYQHFPMPYWLQFMLLYILALIITLLLSAKRIVIFVIRLYQKYGPYDVRSRCLFIPNCSEYMILAIKKYGLIKGIRKGKDRFHRCHAPNGGEDYP